MQKKFRIAALIHEGMEILDFAGPVEVFTSAGFEVYTVAASKKPIISQGVVKITPAYSVADAPQPDIIAVFGGNSSQAIKNKTVIDWIKATAPKTELLFSVCTGAFYYMAVNEKTFQHPKGLEGDSTNVGSTWGSAGFYRARVLFRAASCCLISRQQLQRLLRVEQGNAFR